MPATKLPASPIFEQTTSTTNCCVEPQWPGTDVRTYKTDQSLAERYRECKLTTARRNLRFQCVNIVICFIFYISFSNHNSISLHLKQKLNKYKNQTVEPSVCGVNKSQRDRFNKTSTRINVISYLTKAKIKSNILLINRKQQTNISKRKSIDCKWSRETKWAK